MFLTYKLAYALSALSLILILTSGWSRSRTGLSVIQAAEMALALISAFILGARLWFVFADSLTQSAGHRGFKFYEAHPTEILAIAHGGMSIHGGLIASIICGLVLCRRIKGVAAGQVANHAILQAPIWIAAGRIATFNAGGEPGRESNNALGYRLADGILRWPWHFAEAVAMIVIFSVLIMQIKFARDRSYSLLYVFLVLYAIARLFIDFLRSDARYLCLTLPQWVSASFLVLFSAAYFLRRRICTEICR